MTHVSLFAGIEGFGLAAEKAGFKTVLQVEPDRACLKVLEREWPNVQRIKTVQDLIKRLMEGEFTDETITVISGGDPCPIRSRARGNRPTKHADLSGYFLAVVGLMRPGWVLRENVPAPDVTDFETVLDVLGYRTVIVETNAAPYTSQRRIREFVVGCPSEIERCRIVDILERQCGERINSQSNKKKTFALCLTTNPKRYSSQDNFVWQNRRIRILDQIERTKLAGLPNSWLDGLSKTAIARTTGNACVPQQVYPILRAIAEIEKRERG
jgi:DNA (cytosine-5)-methyltransferase 1